MAGRRRALARRAAAAGLVAAAALLAAASCDNWGGILGALPAATLSWVSPGLPVALAESALALGDFDRDGDLDLAVSGSNDDLKLSCVYRNDGNAGFARPVVGLPGFTGSALAWYDYDGDGLLDLALAGSTVEGDMYASLLDVYRNDGAGQLVPVGLDLLVGSCDLAWGDFDNDGDPDLAAAGYVAGTVGSPMPFPSVFCGVFVNSGDGTFGSLAQDLGNTVVPYMDGLPLDIAWGDFDNDGDLDLVATGQETVIFENQDGVFVQVQKLRDAAIGDVAFADYDSDGDIDLALTGVDFAKVYRNDDGVFIDVAAGLTDTFRSSLAWGDYDNDGDLDLVLAGVNIYTILYRNDGGDSFVEVDTLCPASRGSVAWGDCDSDGDLDLVLTGMTGEGARSALYLNITLAPNTRPTAPAGLAALVSGSAPPYDVEFSWDPASDAQTPRAGLTYNLRVWTDDGSAIAEVMPANADPVTGRRRIPAMGNVQHAGPVAAARRSWRLHLPAGEYLWSVQAVDAAFAGGPWAAGGVVPVP